MIVKNKKAGEQLPICKEGWESIAQIKELKGIKQKNIAHMRYQKEINRVKVLKIIKLKREPNR